MQHPRPPQPPQLPVRTLFRPSLTKFRGGFASSICNLFSKPSRRTDCCHLACCGTLSSDRTQYLLLGNRPNWVKRFFLHFLGSVLVFIVFPLSVYLAHGGDILEDKEVDDAQNRNNNYNDYNGYDYNGNSGGGDEPKTVKVFKADAAQQLFLCVVIMAIFLGVLSWMSASHRMAVRVAILKKIQQEQAPHADERAIQRQLVLLSHETCCVHSCIGCASDDFLYEPIQDLAQYHRASAAQQQQTEEELRPDACSKLWKMLSSVFFFSCCCHCYCQCCSGCALAQEEYEMERWVPKERRLIDYITFQPFASYFPQLEHLRLNGIGGMRMHFSSLSALSKQLVTILLVILLLLFLLAVSPIDKYFTLRNMMVLVATFGQSFIILYFVHWQWNRFDLSLDCLVKCFASGFVLTTTLALGFEEAVSAGVNGVVSVLEIIDVVLALSQDEDLEREAEEDPDQFQKDFAKGHPAIFILQFFLSSFVVAALVEELCKYFGYWMVQHPDFLTPEEMDEATAAEATPFTPPLLSGNTTHAAQAHANGNSSFGASSQQLTAEQRRRSVESRAAGITIAMVATACGFACCENLIYVFVYSGSKSLKAEVITLLLRAVLPVHPIAAAIQSIGVCERDLEGVQSKGLGRILLPSVLLHGTFDFVVMVLAFFMALNADDDDDDDKNNNDANDGSGSDAEDPSDPFDMPLEELVKELLTSLVVSLVIAMCGLLYYAYFAHLQRRRLRMLDSTTSGGGLHEQTVFSLD